MLKDQKKSERLYDFSWWGKSGNVANLREAKIACIYFATDRWNLTQDDKDVIDAVVEDVGRIITRQYNIEIKFQGHADIRASDAHNLRLSKDRLNEVKKYFDQQINRFGLVDDTIFNYLPFIRRNDNPRGEVGARKDKKYWPEDRRVDILVRVYPKSLAQMYIDERECIRRHVWLFTAYFNNAGLWKKYHVEYLISRALFVYNKMSDIVQIKELDLENAKKLIAELNPSQYRILENTLVTCTTDSEKREAIEKSYYLVFSIIWGKLLNTYSKIWKKVKTYAGK